MATGDGQRLKNGQVLRLTLAYQAGEALLDRVAQLAKEDWRRLGVVVELLPMDSKTFDESTSGNTAYRGLSLYPWVMDPSADGMTFWTAENIPTESNSTGQNVCRWRNPESDDLLRRATETLDPVLRRELLMRQQRIWADELPAMPLFFHDEISVHRSELEDWRPTGSETPVTWNCASWRWRERH